MKKLLSMLLAACMALSCEVGVCADGENANTETMTLSAVASGTDQANDNAYYNCGTFDGGYNQHFAYELTGLTNKSITSAKFKFKLKADANTTVKIYETKTPYSGWTKTTSGNISYISATLEKSDVFASKAINANKGTECEIDITEFVSGKFNAGKTAIQLGVTAASAVQLCSRDDLAKLVIEYTDKPAEAGETTKTLSWVKQATNTDDAGVIYNCIVYNPFNWYIAYDVNDYMNKSIKSAYFTSNKTPTSSGWLKKITTPYANWTSGKPSTSLPEMGEQIASISANQNVNVDITSYVKEQIEKGDRYIQFGVGASSSCQFGHPDSDPPKLVLTYVDAPIVTITAPASTKVKEGTSVTFTATVSDNAGGTVTATLDDENVELTEDNGTYSYVAANLENGAHTFVITAKNSAGVETKKQITVNAGFVSSTNTIDFARRKHNVSADNGQYGNAQYNFAVWGDENQNQYFAYDLTSYADKELKNAKFKFTKRDTTATSIVLYDIKAAYADWASSVPEIETTAFKTLSVSEQKEYEIDLTEYVEKKLAAGEKIIQFAVSSTSASVQIGHHEGTKPQLEVTTTTQLRPTITAEKDYTYVTPGENTFSFTVDGNDEAIETVTAVLDNGTAEALTANSNVYSITKTLTEGTHTLEVTATNENGVKRTLTINVAAKTFDINDRAITFENGTASGTTKIYVYDASITMVSAVIAAYDANWKLLKAGVQDYTFFSNDGTDISVGISDVPSTAKYIKMFVWNGVDSLKPFCPAQVYTIN